MRGSPPLHLVLFAVGFALLALPLAHLTFARPAASDTPPAAQEQSATVPTVLRLRFAHRPQSLSVKLDGHELLAPAALQDAKSVIEFRQNLAIGKEGIEFLVTAQWPEGTPDTALSLEVEPDGLDVRSLTHWSLGASLTEVFTFDWKS